MTDQPFYEPKREPKGAERRRERRIDFSQLCQVTVVSPAWAMTREPVAGRTEDITLNGLRVRLTRANRALVASWQDGIMKDVELKIELELPEVADFPRLKGQIVWIHMGEEQPDGGEQECSIGILFSILKTKDQVSLQELIVSLS